MIYSKNFQLRQFFRHNAYLISDCEKFENIHEVDESLKRFCEV